MKITAKTVGDLINALKKAVKEKTISSKDYWWAWEDKSINITGRTLEIFPE